MNYKKIFLSLFLCFGTAFLGSAVTVPSIGTWYSGLTKPFFNPPNWLFGPVWSLLFLLMAISFYLVWNQKHPSKSALRIFLIQLGLNFLWSFLFFYLHQPLLAFIEIIIFWFFILKTILRFRKINPTAGVLLYPYLVWVFFASILNLSIVYLNK